MHSDQQHHGGEPAHACFHSTAQSHGHRAAGPALRRLDRQPDRHRRRHAAAGDGAATLPDGSTVPDRRPSRRRPASPPPTSSHPAAAGGDTDAIIATASTSGIPAAALVAYQRAEAVINSADKTCQIPWQLIAAIGRVESDHGRFGGNTLDDDGVAQPGIYGIALNGKNNTQNIIDTDAGQYDNDTRFDRAVGPMQFIPSTWSVVGRRRRQRRQAQPAGHRRRGARDRGLPLLGRRRPLHRRRPARQRLPLQPQQRLRRPGALDHAGLHGRRLHLGAQRHDLGGRLPARHRPAPADSRRQGQRQAASGKGTRQRRRTSDADVEPTEPPTQRRRHRRRPDADRPRPSPTPTADARPRRPERPGADRRRPTRRADDPAVPTLAHDHACRRSPIGDQSRRRPPSRRSRRVRSPPCDLSARRSTAPRSWHQRRCSNAVDRSVSTR